MDLSGLALDGDQFEVDYSTNTLQLCYETLDFVAQGDGRGLTAAPVATSLVLYTLERRLNLERPKLLQTFS
jgi:hypothetical protein